MELCFIFDIKGLRIKFQIMNRCLEFSILVAISEKYQKYKYSD